MMPKSTPMLRRYGRAREAPIRCLRCYEKCASYYARAYAMRRYAMALLFMLRHTLDAVTATARSALIARCAELRPVKV